MPARTDHDALFKRLLMVFFREFLDLFVPELAVQLADEPILFLDKETLGRTVDPDRREADLVVQARLRSVPATFLVHGEHQAQPDTQLSQRMFRYFARFHDQHNLPIYPIALCSHARVRRMLPDHYQIGIASKKILDFQYHMIQLNRLDWRTYLQTPNPVAAALMARMLVAPVDRWLVKALSLRMMAGLPLHASQQRMLGQFIDIYLPLPHPQEVAFRQEVAGFLPHEQEVVMENIGSWERKGRAEGRKEGRKEGQQQLITRLLARRFGALPAELANALNPLTSAQLVALGEALLDFTSLVDLQDWLAALRAQEINLPDVP